MFDEYYTEFWSKKEVAYQHVHMFWALWLGFIVYSLIGSLYAPVITGLIAGLCLEMYQYRKYIASGELPKTWTDSLRDLCFWTIGGCLNYILIFGG